MCPVVNRIYIGPLLIPAFGQRLVFAGVGPTVLFVLVLRDITMYNFSHLSCAPSHHICHRTMEASFVFTSTMILFKNIYFL